MLTVSNLGKSYQAPDGTVEILSDISFTLSPGDGVAVMGPSGSGKSTLLYILGTLETPSSGNVSLDGQNPFALSPDALAAFRNRHIGFVFQDHCLLPQCTVLENVLVPTLVGERDRQSLDRAKSLIERVGLAPRINHVPAQLSGGEKQRAALARALVRQPKLLLCDEPTGNLDRAAAEVVSSMLVDMHRQQNTMLMVVTHSPELAARFPRRFELVDRQLRPHRG